MLMLFIPRVSSFGGVLGRAAEVGPEIPPSIAVIPGQEHEILLSFSIHSFSDSILVAYSDFP